MEEKWIEVAKELGAADVKILSVEEASALLARVQEMERAANVILMQAIVRAEAPANATVKAEEQVYECVGTPETIPEDYLVEVQVDASEIDAEGACIRRRVEALDLGRTAWGKLKVVNGGGGYGRTSHIYPEALEVLARALKRYRGAFVEIDMSRAPLTAEQMGTFAEKVLKDNTTLRVLILDNSALGPDGVAFLAGSLRGSKDSALTTLKLLGVGMDDAALLRFCKVLKADDAVPKLATVHVGGNGFKNLKPLVELVRTKSSLSELSIANLQHVKEVDGFGQAIAESSIANLRAHGIPGDYFAKEVVVAAKANKMAHLKIQGDKFAREDYDALGAAIGDSTSILTLEVDLGNVMKMPSREEFFSGIGKNTSLEELFFYQCRLDDESSKQLARAVAKHPTLRKLKASGANNLKGPCAGCWADAIEKSTTLCEMEIETSWKDDQLLLILDALPNSSSLKTLKLRAGGSYKLRQAIEARMEGDPKAEDLIASYWNENAKQKGLKQVYDEQVAKQTPLAIRQFSTGDKVMVYAADAGGARTAPIAGCVLTKDADNWYSVSRNDGEPTLRCTLKQIRPSAGYALPAGSIVDATALAGGREYRAKVVEVLPEDKYKVVPFWNTANTDKDTKTVERHQLIAILP